MIHCLDNLRLNKVRLEEHHDRLEMTNIEIECQQGDGRQADLQVLSCYQQFIHLKKRGTHLSPRDIHNVPICLVSF